MQVDVRPNRVAVVACSGNTPTDTQFPDVKSTSNAGPHFVIERIQS